VNTDTDEIERLLREQRPNVANVQELLDLMEQTRNTRRSWISNNNPSITEILRRYPRFQDVPDSVSHFPLRL
jgi:hypothetical protein